MTVVKCGASYHAPPVPESGVADPKTVQAMMRKVLEAQPAIRIDYLAICEPDTLEPLDRIDRQAVILGAIRLGSVRLIDNVLTRRKRGGT